MSCEQEPIVTPRSEPMSPLMLIVSSAEGVDHSKRQKLQRNSPVAIFRLISVAPQRPHLLRPSLALTSDWTTCGLSRLGGLGGPPKAAATPGAEIGRAHV